MANGLSTHTATSSRRHHAALSIRGISLTLFVAAWLIRLGPWRTETVDLLGPIWAVLLVVAFSAAVVGVVVLAPVHSVVTRAPGLSRRAALKALAAFALLSTWGRIRGTRPAAVGAAGVVDASMADETMRVSTGGVPESTAIAARGGLAGLQAIEGLEAGASSATLVTEFGATGDGVTDDAPAIQACIDASKPGDCIHFPPTGANGGTTTYLVGADIRLAGNRKYASSMGAPGDAGVEIKYADGVNGAAVLISAACVNNSSWCGYPIHISNLRINGNREHNSTGHGVALMNYNSSVEDCFVTACPDDGIHVSDRNAAGTVIANSCVETRIVGNKVNNCSGHGIMVLDTDFSGRLTDGYCIRNIVSNTDDDAIVIARSSGWWVSENHAYTCQRDGIVVGALWNTYLVNNEVDRFGDAQGGELFCGFRVESILDGRPSVISGNVASTTEYSNDSYRYYSIRNAWDQNCSFVQFFDNKLHRDSSACDHAVGLHLDANGGELHFYEQGTMLEGLPTNIVPSGKCHRYHTSGQVLDYMETLDRDTIDPSASSPLPWQGTMYLTYFTAHQFLTASQLTSATRGTAGAGASAARMALFEVDPGTGDGTCIARTSSDPTLWRQRETAFERPIVDDGHGQAVSSVNLVQGRRYAFALLHVGSSVNPTLAGKTGISGLVAGKGPTTRRSGYITRQTDIPTSFSGATIDANTKSGNYYYGRIT